MDSTLPAVLKGFRDLHRPILLCDLAPASRFQPRRLYTAILDSATVAGEAFYLARKEEWVAKRVLEKYPSLEQAYIASQKKKGKKRKTPAIASDSQPAKKFSGFRVERFDE